MVLDWCGAGCKWIRKEYRRWTPLPPIPRFIVCRSAFCTWNFKTGCFDFTCFVFKKYCLWLQLKHGFPISSADLSRNVPEFHIVLTSWKRERERSKLSVRSNLMWSVVMWGELTWFMCSDFILRWNEVKWSEFRWSSCG